MIIFWFINNNGGSVTSIFLHNGKTGASGFLKTKNHITKVTCLHYTDIFIVRAKVSSSYKNPIKQIYICSVITVMNVRDVCQMPIWHVGEVICWLTRETYKNTIRFLVLGLFAVLFSLR